MKRESNPKIIEILNDVLTAELTAINQYFLHAEMCRDWGYEFLGKKIRAESIDEMRHAESLIERVLYLNGIPNVQRLSKVSIGESVKEILECDLALEYDALKRLNEGIPVCVAEGDNGTRELLESILKSEEEHVDWLESQLELVAQAGLENYLASQIRKDQS
ncbi:MAG: bacterioferritin [Myxococcota bacterium]